MFGGSFGGTTTANNQSMFGGSAKPGGGLFGSNVTSQPGVQAGPGAQNTGFGNGFSNPPSTNNGGLFGNTNPGGNNNTTSGTGGGFGNSTTNNGLFANKSGNTSSGLFGNKSTNAFGTTSTNNPSGSSGAGMFGSKPASGGLFGNTNNSSGGLFGTSNTNNNTNNTGGLFGNTNNNNNTGGIFGNKPASGGLFGNSSNNTGLFGNTNTNSGTAPNTSIFNNPQIQLNAITRVGDLPEPIKKELQEFDKYINQQHLIATTLENEMNSHDTLIKSLPKDINYLYVKLKSTKQALKLDSKSLNDLKELNNELTDDINKMLQLILQLSTPGTKLSSSYQLHEFFVKKIKHYHGLIQKYEESINEMISILQNLELEVSQGFGSFLNILDTIKAQFNLFMELCENLALLHNNVLKLDK